MLLIFAGEPRLGVSGVLVGTGLILVVTWARGFPAREWLATAILFVGIALVGSVMFAVVVLVGAVLLQLWLDHRMRSRLSTELERLDAAEAMPGAETAVAELEAAGFRRSGAFAGQMPRLHGTRRVVGCVLTGPDGDRFAFATDRFVDVASRFGGRWLLTTNRGLTPVSGHELRQVVSRGRPRELAKAHESALDVLAERGVEPDRFANEDDAVEAAMELERSAIALVSEMGVVKSLGIEPRRKTRQPVLRDDARSRRRVDDWLAADAPASIQV